MTEEEKLLAEAGKVLEGVTPGKWEPHHHDDYSELAVYHPEFTGIGHVYEASDANFIAWCREGVPALLARIAAMEAQIKGLETELHTMKTAGIIEVSVRNSSVFDYMKHWEGRAEAAETALAAMTEASK